jgi:hypothetical protein
MRRWFSPAILVAVLASLRKNARQLIVRSYSLLMLLVLGWAGYLAFASLLRTVFVPQPVPRRFLEWQGRIDVAALRSENVPGLTGPAARAPLGHYHRVEQWFELDPRNGCTLSGCHDPLPHTKKMKVPSFANMHTTFLACQMCHEPDVHAADSVAWYSTATGQVQPIPAVLRLRNYLES